ncbi:hypothetical protein QBC34DRAFT_42917 [Podospora aff. communis PSN243]|uniref:Uncharacterized protein n=1 Tax=Podospora aff. communis PSN243 TaxID=3040156 RepID=A0AAV9FYK7_9PEZI|nr:hypothetical protein QBC34DRAFT_42917 [Podospora aff. communis PSN243]
MAKDLFTPYISLPPSSVPANTPLIRLKITSPDTHLSTTLPYHIYFTLHYATENPKPCILIFSPFSTFLPGPSAFILLRHLPDGSVERVPIEDVYATGKCIRLTDTYREIGSDLRYRELKPGEKLFVGMEILPEWYHTAVEVGERYSLVWPGAVVGLWTWGGREENKARCLTGKEEGSGCVIPGGSRLEFVVKEEEERWPGREACEVKRGFRAANWEEWMWRIEEMKRKRGPPPPIGVEERVDGAPKLAVRVECPESLSLGSDAAFDVKVTFTYDSDDFSAGRAITLHTYLLDPASQFGMKERDGFRCYRRHTSGDGRDVQWLPWDDDDDDTCFLLVDDADRHIRVSEDKDFVSLRPGESWSTTYRLHWAPSGSNLPDDLKVGDEFRCWFNGLTQLDWWDWGHVDNEHADTVVTAPCFRSRVLAPADNGGRPKLVVPASNTVEFRVVE